MNSPYIYISTISTKVSGNLFQLRSRQVSITDI